MLCVFQKFMETGENCVWRAVSSAVYALARRPRGQQLLRQVDRVLFIVEILVRWMTGCDSLSYSNYFPVPIVTTLILFLIVLPSILVCVVVISIPILPFMLPSLVCSPFTNGKWRRTFNTILSIYANPHLMATYINRKRRSMRAIRFDGVRAMQREETLHKPDSLAAKLFIWWPVTVIVTAGDLIDLGGPYIQSERTPSNQVSEVSPRKRKFHQLQGGSDEEFDATTSEEETQEGSSSDESGFEMSPDMTEIIIIRRLSETMEALNCSANSDDGGDEDSDPNYQPDCPETDNEEIYEEDEEMEDEKKDGGKGIIPPENSKMFLEENLSLTGAGTETVKVKGEATVNSSTMAIPPNMENSPLKSAAGDEQTESVLEMKGDHEAYISAPSLYIPEDKLLTPSGKGSRGTSCKSAEESLLLLQAEAANSGRAASGPETADGSMVHSLPSEKEKTGAEDSEQSETKDASKSKSRFGGFFRRGNDK